jgi:transcriptional regulator with XRE-family HTH domain
MLTSFSPENVIRARLTALGLSVDSFAALVGVKQTTLSRNLRGIAPLNGDEAKRYLALTAELQQLGDVFQPFALGLIDPRVLEVMLEDFRSNREHWAQLNSAMSKIRRNVEETLASRTQF